MQVDLILLLNEDIAVKIIKTLTLFFLAEEVHGLQEQRKRKDQLYVVRNYEDQTGEP